jgi:Domain of unknown function (DUF4145)
MTQRTQQALAHCNRCGGERNHRVLKKCITEWQHSPNASYTVWSETEFAMLQCAGCDDVRLRKKHLFSEDTDDEGHPLVHETYYPASIFRPQPDWLYYLDNEWHIRKLVDEVYRALQNDAKTLASMGLRAIIESIMIDKVGDQGSFAKNISLFRQAGFISNSQESSLLAALELGHATIHRGHMPTDFQLQTAIDITENLIHSLYFIEDRAKASINGLPSRKK